MILKNVTKIEKLKNPTTSQPNADLCHNTHNMPAHHYYHYHVLIFRHLHGPNTPPSQTCNEAKYTTLRRQQTQVHDHNVKHGTNKLNLSCLDSLVLQRKPRGPTIWEPPDLALPYGKGRWEAFWVYKSRFSRCGVSNGGVIALGDG